MIYLILPAYNEEKNLIKVFKKLNSLRIVKNLSVILVDDCSTDNTLILKGKKNKFKLDYIKHKKNKGLSSSLETGFKKINNKLKKRDLIITMDSDNTHPIQIIPKMISIMEKKESDLIIASRFIKNSKVNGLSFFRTTLSLLAKIIFSLFFPFKGLKEYTCNYRIYRSFLIKKLMKEKNFFKNEDFNIAVKILLFFIKSNKNIRISEYPLILNYHFKEGQSKMKVTKNIFLTLKVIFQKKFLN
jgi:dolichol-phosphate mannosyltransferase